MGYTAEQAAVGAIGLSCPKCGQPSMECRYWDSGGLDWYDNFRHRCTNPGCGHVLEELDQYGGMANYEHEWPHCPFCARRAPDVSTPHEKAGKCSKCSKNSAVCIYWESGPPTAFIDNFAHQCTDVVCAHREERLDINAGELGYEGEPYCPMCQKNKCVGEDCRCK